MTASEPPFLPEDEELDPFSFTREPEEECQSVQSLYDNELINRIFRWAAITNLNPLIGELKVKE